MRETAVETLPHLVTGDGAEAQEVLFVFVLLPDILRPLSRIVHTEVVAAKEELSRARGLARVLRVDSCAVEGVLELLALPPAPLRRHAVAQDMRLTGARRETMLLRTPRLRLLSHRGPARRRP